MYGLSGIDYRVATLSKSYLTVTGIAILSLKSIAQFYHDKLTFRVVSWARGTDGRTDVQTLNLDRLSSLKDINQQKRISMPFSSWHEGGVQII